MIAKFALKSVSAMLADSCDLKIKILRGFSPKIHFLTKVDFQVQEF
jgi:hypothetical protein